MNFKQKVERGLLRKKIKETPTALFERITFYLVKKGGFSLSDLMESPTPLVLSMYNQLADYYKHKEKAMKKANKR